LNQYGAPQYHPVIHSIPIHRGWINGHDPSYIPYSCLQNTNIAFRPTCPKVAFRKRLPQHQKRELGHGLTIPSIC